MDATINSYDAWCKGWLESTSLTSERELKHYYQTAVSISPEYDDCRINEDYNFYDIALIMAAMLEEFKKDSEFIDEDSEQTPNTQEFQDWYKGLHYQGFDPSQLNYWFNFAKKIKPKTTTWVALGIIMGNMIDEYYPY